MASPQNRHLRRLLGLPTLHATLSVLVGESQTRVEDSVMEYKDSLRVLAEKEEAEKEQRRREVQEAARKRVEAMEAQRLEDAKILAQAELIRERMGMEVPQQPKVCPIPIIFNPANCSKVYPAGGPCSQCTAKQIVCIGTNSITCDNCKETHTACSHNGKSFVIV